MNQTLPLTVDRGIAAPRAVHFGGRVAAPELLRAKIDVRHVTFRYGDQVALRDVTVPIYERHLTAIMGPSGCGRSTLLRAFNRMHDHYPDQRVDGEILLDGENILGDGVDADRLRRRVGMVFQQPAPFPMSIYDNVAYGVRVHEDLPRARLDERVESALRSAALWDEVKDVLRTSGMALSGGQQQRLCIARTIAVQPEVILLDEPCSALDPGSAAQIEETMAELKEAFTLVLITHNLQQAARVSDFSAFMLLGEMIEFGPTRDMFVSPRDARTSNFVTGRFG
jgi:phosphate transport system ATP-binding protein